MTIRVLAADDQRLMLAAYEMTLRDEPDIDLVGQAANGLEALEETRRLRPDVILMDVRMPVMDGVAATRAVVDEFSSVRILVLTTFDVDEYMIEAIRAGASGFLLKDVSPDELIKAIRVVAAGDAMLTPTSTRILLDALFGTSPPPVRTNGALAKLTEAEVRVLTLVGKGLSNHEISDALFVAETTVRTHLRHVLEKLELRDRIQAVVFAYDTGLVRPTPRA
jgi:DNA-binding NarL/FixJ family response regulator